MQEIKVSDTNVNQRIDKFLLKYLNDAPKSFIYKMFRKKNIKLNGKKIEGSEMLSNGDVITLYLSDETIDNFKSKKEFVTEDVGNIAVVYEDENILIVNKPYGVLTQPAKETDNDTMIHRITKYLIDTGEYVESEAQGFTPSVCNRLDLNTSGLIITGKNLNATQRINELIREHKVDKFYTAVVYGQVRQEREIKGFHYKNFATNEVSVSARRKSSIDKEVITKIYPIKSNGEYTLLSIKLVTGKSHQIRASLNTVNTPIVGDRKYGNYEVNQFFKRKYGINNQLLTANKVIINDEDGMFSYLNGQTFEAPLYKQFRSVVGDLFE